MPQSSRADGDYCDGHDPHRPADDECGGPKGNTRGKQADAGEEQEAKRELAEGGTDAEDLGGATTLAYHLDQLRLGQSHLRLDEIFDVSDDPVHDSRNRPGILLAHLDPVSRYE
jgi:hypothetical protein